MNNDVITDKEEIKLLQRYRQEKEHEEYKYLNLIKDILETGYEQDDRTKVGTLTKHGAMIRFNLRNNVIPIITTRKTFYRAAIEELLWLLRGETDVKPLQNKNIHIWDGNTTKDFIEKRGLAGIVPENDVGALYGFQIRNWNGDYEMWRDYKIRSGIDQLEKLIEGLKKDPNGRRHIISNYNVEQLNLGVLEPCHTIYGFNVDVRNKEIHSSLWQRSTDVLCGLSLNILHISILTHILAKLLGYTAGDFVWTGNNNHVYNSHKENAKIQCERTPYPFPTLEIAKDIKTIEDIEGLVYEDFKINDYKCHPALKYEMAV